MTLSFTFLVFKYFIQIEILSLMIFFFTFIKTRDNYKYFIDCYYLLSKILRHVKFTRVLFKPVSDQGSESSFFPGRK